MNARFAMAAHITGLLAFHESTGCGAVTSDTLARSVNTNPVVVRRLLGDLKKAGLVQTRRGAGGGSVLARSADAITLRDIYEAVSEDSPLIPCAPGTADSSCDLGRQVDGWLHGVIDQAEDALKAQLAQVDIAQLRDVLVDQVSGCRAS